MVEDLEMLKYTLWINLFGPNTRKYFERFGQGPLKPFLSIEKPPILELKPLPKHLRYAYLGKSYIFW
jgi:hypothetical protein